MVSTAISVSLILTLDVSRTWLECTALCKEAAEVMLARGVRLTPARCGITRLGTLEVDLTGAEPHDGTAAGLADLLAALVAGIDAPAEVHHLATSGVAQRHTLGEGLAALLRVTPADRPAAIGALADRALRVRAEVTAETSPAALAAVGRFTALRARARRREVHRPRWSPATLMHQWLS